MKFGLRIPWTGRIAARTSWKRHVTALAFLFLPVSASAGVACWTIQDPDQRALCRATTSKSRGDCVAIADYALRKQCEVRTGAPTSACNAITDQWERQKCKDEAARR